MKHVNIENLLAFGVNGYNVIRWGFRDFNLETMQAVSVPSEQVREDYPNRKFVYLAGPSVAEELMSAMSGHPMFPLFEYEHRQSALENNIIGELNGHPVIECRNLPWRILIGAWVHDNKIVSHIGTWIKPPHERLNLPAYQCHKIVNAAKIEQMSAYVGDYDPVTLHLEGGKEHAVSRNWYNTHAPTTGGYFVVYDSGHTSFSPEEPFEKGYTRI